MRDPSAVELLDAWEAGHGVHREAAAIALLEVASPDMPPDRLADLPIGERDARLLDVRERLFGPTLTSAVGCAGCGEQLELTFQTDEIRTPLAPDRSAVFRASAGGSTATFRLPTTADLLAIAGSPDEDDARRRLAQRCVLSIETPVRTKAVGTLTPELVDGIEAAMAEADPQADIELEVTCPACGVASRSVFDIGFYLRLEVDAWARRTLHEVAVIASSLGWHERDILAMSAWRRRYYFEAAAG